MEFEEFRNPIKEARQGRKNQKNTITTDMNAMVDIAFLLLTFFLLTTTLAKQKAIELVMPVTDKAETETQVIKESRAMVLIPLPNNKLALFYGNRRNQAKLIPYGAKGIRTELKLFTKNTKDPIVLLKPHKDCVFENIIEILDELNISGINRYTIDKVTLEDFATLETSKINWD